MGLELGLALAKIELSAFVCNDHEAEIKERLIHLESAVANPASRQVDLVDADLVMFGPGGGGGDAEAAPDAPPEAPPDAGGGGGGDEGGEIS